MPGVELSSRTASEWPHPFAYCLYSFFIGGQVVLLFLK
jgi:hypothetical protein